MIKKTALLKLILASCLLSSVICAGISLTAPSGGSCTGTILIKVRASTGSTDIQACISSTDPIYTASKGCGAYVAVGATLTDPITAGTTATGLTCDVGARIEDGSTTCATTGYIKVKAKQGSSAVADVCIDSANPTYLSLTSKGCAYYGVDTGTLPVNSLTFTCGGVLVKSAATACETGFIKVSVKQGTAAVGDACVSITNPTYLTELQKGCGYYAVDTGSFPVNSATFTCTGVGILDASSGCLDGFIKIKVKTSTQSASAFGCVSTTNSIYTGTSPTANACGFFKVAASVSVSSFPIVSATLTCGGVQVTAAGSGCDFFSQHLIPVRTSATGLTTKVCVKTANTLYMPVLKSCQYFLLDSTTNLNVLPANSDTISCGGTDLKTYEYGMCQDISYDMIIVKKSASSPSVQVCVDPANTIYAGVKAKGCSYYLVSSDTNLDTIPSGTGSLTCGGVTFKSGSCAAGSTKIKVKVGTTLSDVCVKNTNPIYVAESAKGCTYYTVTSATASENMVCGGTTFTSSCTAGVQTSIPLRTSVTGSTTNACVKNINPAFLAAGPNCQFYLVSSTTSSDTLVCSGIGALTAPQSGACPTGKVLLTVKDSTGASTQACFNESDALYAVQNCESYLVTVTGSGTFPNLPLDTSTLTCTCSSTSTQSVKNLVGLTKKACIPNTQWRVNCDSYKKTSLGQYNCTGCQQGASFIVPLGKDTAGNNPKNYTDACTPAKVPGCGTYGLYLTSATDGTPFNGDGTAYTNAVGCVTCSSGYAALSAGSTKFLFWSTTTNTVGKACPVDGSISTTDCSQVKLVDGVYVCNTCSGSFKFQTSYYNSASQLTVGCLKSGSSSSAFYKNMDINCELFSWGNADLFTSFTCIRCKSGYLLKTVYDSDGTTTYKRCVPFTTFITSNCKDLIAADLTIASPVYACFKCVTGYTQLNVAVVSGSIYSVLCAKTGRFSLISLCTKYDANMNFDLVFGLTCSTCSSGSAPSCTSTCATAGGFAAKNSQETPADICVTTNFVDSCAKYSTTSSTGGLSGENNCVECKGGFTNVTTSATTTSGRKAIICISDTQKIADCNVYNHADLACYECKEKLGFDRNTWKCRGPTDVSASCTKSVMVGDKLVCITCPIGYTLKDGACVTAVPFCASLSSTGVCSACVRPTNYQLINNKCILKPANCATVNENGVCTACKPGFLLTVDDSCAVASSNTCPAGQFLSNGVCVTGTIANCQTYDKNGKCESCKTGFILSTNGKQCTVSSSGSSSRYPNAPPCPPDTNKFRYVRNPSDPNGPCVPVDVQCTYSRDDGHCIVCKDGEFAHTDGLCYKIVFPQN